MCASAPPSSDIDSVFKRSGRRFAAGKHVIKAKAYSIMMRVEGPMRDNKRRIADGAMPTQPAVGEKFSRAR